VKSAEASLSLLDRASKGSGKSRKTLKKAKEAEGKAKEAEGMTKVPDNPMRVTFQVDLENAKKAAENAKSAMTTSASQMFAFYASLLSVKLEYTWNKIVKEQTEGNLYVDLHGVSQSGPRGMSRKLFNDTMVFHLLAVFPINAAEQGKYYITNVLEKPQRINVCQFVWKVGQLNAYIA
jgi:hypothetical protein